MKYVPHAYQTYATEFILTHPVAAILLQMGLGKSVITLTAMKTLFERREIRRALVIAPLRVARDTWPEEIEKWDHLKGLTYSVAVGMAAERLGRFIGQYRAAYFLPDRRNAQRVFTWRPRPGAEEEIYRRIGDITVSMKSVDYLKMPECIFSTVHVHMDGEERKKYETLKEKLFLQVREGQRVDTKNAKSLCGKLSQMANGACYAEDGSVARIHDRKLDALEDLIEASAGHPLLITYWYRHDLERIRERFPQVRHLVTARDLREWNAGQIEAAAIHPASAGHGLNLQQGGSTLIWFGLTWSLELYQQTNARLWRQGQTADTVVIHHIVTKDSIDEQILAVLRRKDQTQESLIRAVRANLGRGEGAA